MNKETTRNAPQSSAVPRVGDRLGDYEIVARLRSGGMATVYVARRRGVSGFSKRVAIKVVHPHLAEDATFTRMFIDEALLSARIEHPNCVHIHELGEASGAHFLVMEYVRGGSLAQLLQAVTDTGRRLAPPLAVYIASQTANGLGAAHSATDEDGQHLGVVHRDVSPQNVLLSRGGHVKLIDFGVAKARGRAQKTITGILKGKFRYMAPEQARGLDIDHRADIYALGIVLWEMLTGRRLFDHANELRVLDMVQRSEVRPASSLAPEVGPALDAVLLRALAKRPSDRFQTAVDFRRALIRAQPGLSTIDSEALAGVVAAYLRDGEGGVVDVPSQSGLVDPDDFDPDVESRRWTLPLQSNADTDPSELDPELASDLSRPDLEAIGPMPGLISEPPPGDSSADGKVAPPPSAGSPGGLTKALFGVLVLGGVLGVAGWLAIASPSSTPPPEPLSPTHPDEPANVAPRPDAGAAPVATATGPTDAAIEPAIDSGIDAGIDARPPPSSGHRRGGGRRRRARPQGPSTGTRNRGVLLADEW